MNKDVTLKLDKFFSAGITKQYKKGAVLVSPGQTSGIFFLKEGIVKRYAISPNGEELTLNLYKPLSFFPLEYTVNGSLSHHYFETMTSATIIKVSSDKFLEFIKSEPEVLLDLVSRIYTGLEGFFQRMEYLMVGSANSRLIIELIIFAKRFGEKKGKSTLINLKVTEKELASLSGITRETVSREIHKLKNKGLLNYNKSTLVINDLSKLEEEIAV